MAEQTDVKPSPVIPAVIEVPDLTAACAALGLPAPAAGATSVAIELLPGCTIEVAEVDGEPTPFAYLCVANVEEARSYIRENFGSARSGPDSVDPETFRLRGAILAGGGMVIDAVQCHVAVDNGVPCSAACNPFLSFA